MQEERLDCLIIGAGPAGLTAALYLARFRRRLCVLDAGRSRAALIPVSHNFPGYPEGIAGRALLHLLTEQAVRYGAAIQHAEVTGLRRGSDGFVAETTAGPVTARTVLLATGCVDRTPPWPGAADAVRGGFLRYCPICDGYEVSGRRVGVLGSGDHAVREALFVRHYTAHVTLLTGGGLLHASAVLEQRRRAAGIGLVEAWVEKGFVEGGQFLCELAGGARLRFDSLYLALGCSMRSELACALGATTTAEKELVVDAHQCTTVEGLYAAGDVVKALNQMAVATGQAAVAATAIHNRLREAELAGPGGPSPPP